MKNVAKSPILKKMDTENNKIKFGKEFFVGQSASPLLEHYDIIKPLGKGGYAKVYEVQHKKTKEIRACKHLSKANIPDYDKFKREIQILIKTDHPNIIKLYEVFESKRSLYLVMELCRGGELFDRVIEHMETGEMYTEKDAAKMFIQIMSSIDYCHKNGIVHRDLKPENLLYLNKGEEKNNPIKIIDFGLSQYITSEEKLKSKVGTAYYVAPEILQGKYSEKCDVWSAGVILYILLSGDPPFNGQNDSEIYSQVAKMEYHFGKKWDSMSSEVKDLITHMLAPEEERYTAAEVISHPWVKKMTSHTKESMKKLPFDIQGFKAYRDNNAFKKMIIVYIASRLNQNEVKDLEKTFDFFDKNKDGQITLNEFEQGLSELKTKGVDTKEIKDLFHAIDTDINGKIDYTEFLAAALTKQQYIKDERLLEAFSAFDKDNDGKISKEEIMDVLKLEKEDEKKVEGLIKLADKNGDGLVDYNEFLEIMKK